MHKTFKTIGFFDDFIFGDCDKMHKIAIAMQKLCCICTFEVFLLAQTIISFIDCEEGTSSDNSPPPLFSESDGDSASDIEAEANINAGSGIPSAGTVLAFNTATQGSTSMPGSDVRVFPNITHNMHRDTFTFQSVHKHEHVRAQHTHCHLEIKVLHHHHYHTHNHFHLSCQGGQQCLGGQPQPEPSYSDDHKYVGKPHAVKSGQDAVKSSKPKPSRKRRRDQKW